MRRKGKKGRREAGGEERRGKAEIQEKEMKRFDGEKESQREKSRRKQN